MMPPLPTLSGLPVLETERLILRGPQASDWPAFRDFNMSDRARFVGGPKPLQEVFQKFASYFGHWPLRGFGRFVLTDRTSAAPLGHAGPLQILEDVTPELTWSLWSPDAEGKGYAFEAARAINRWIFTTLGWAEAKAEIHADNHASHALARKLGGTVIEGAATQWMPGATVYHFHAKTVLQ